MDRARALSLSTAEAGSGVTCCCITGILVSERRCGVGVRCRRIRYSWYRRRRRALSRSERRRAIGGMCSLTRPCRPSNVIPRVRPVPHCTTAVTSVLRSLSDHCRMRPLTGPSSPARVSRRPFSLGVFLRSVPPDGMKSTSVQGFLSGRGFALPRAHSVPFRARVPSAVAFAVLPAIGSLSSGASARGAKGLPVRTPQARAGVGVGVGALT
jgi:hypothetical protein